MALEDFTTYTLGGADSGKLNITANQIILTGILSTDHFYLYKDFGSGFFNPNNPIEIRFLWRLSSSGTCRWYYGSISDQFGAITDIDFTGASMVYPSEYARTPKLYTYSKGQNASAEAASVIITTQYYVTVKYIPASDEWDIVFRIDSHTGSIERQATVACPVRPDVMRYLQPCFSRNGLSGTSSTVVMNDLEIIAPVVGEPTLAKPNPLMWQDF